MKTRLTFTGPIVTALRLIKKRWTGLPTHIFLQHIEEMPSAADIHGERATEQFPQAFWLQGTRESLNTGDLETEYLPWADESNRFSAAMRQYSGGNRLPNMLDEIIFKLSDVEAYEQENPWLKHRLVDPDKAWEKRLSLEEDVPIIAALEQELAETQEKLTKAQRTKKIRKKRIEELEEQLAMADEGLSGVDAARWKDSVSTALSFIIAIFQGDEKQTWKKVEFEDSFAQKCPSYHISVRAMAWKALPEEFKLSRGRPKENKKNLSI